MSETRDPQGSEEFEKRIKEALGGVATPPGLRERIRAALDEEDARRTGSGGYDCAREGEPLDYQIKECDWPNHTNGLQLADGGLWRFVIRDSLDDTLLARSMRGRRVRVEGNLYAAIAHLDVQSFVPLARCHATRRIGALPVL